MHILTVQAYPTILLATAVASTSRFFGKVLLGEHTRVEEQFSCFQLQYPSTKNCVTQMLYYYFLQYFFLLHQKYAPYVEKFQTRTISRIFEGNWFFEIAPYFTLQATMVNEVYEFFGSRLPKIALQFTNQETKASKK